MEEIKVLDHGYVKFVEAWGSDERIIEAARMSTGKGFLGWGPKGKEICERCSGKGKHGRWGDSESDDNAVFDCQTCSGKGFKEIPGDEKLLKFLYENKHSTPFEMAGMVIEVQAPIFVLREWHRHRTQSYNEMSARYIPLPDVNYVPTVDRLLMNSQTNKQAGVAKGAEELNESGAMIFIDDLRGSYELAERAYKAALSEGVPKELARLMIPVGRYSRMRASANLRNWLGFLTLRMAPNAQWEIRQYANEVGSLIQQQFPRTWDLFAAEQKR